MRKLSKMSLEEIYFEYWNNFITFERMAEYYEVEQEFIEKLINLARELYNKVNP
jgi:hypothetical protein